MPRNNSFVPCYLWKKFPLTNLFIDLYTWKVCRVTIYSMKVPGEKNATQHLPFPRFLGEMPLNLFIELYTWKVCRVAEKISGNIKNFLKGCYLHMKYTV